MSENDKRVADAQPSPAPELEQPEVVAYRVDWKTNPKGSMRRTLSDRAPTIQLLTMDYPNAKLIGSEPLISQHQHDRIVGALRDDRDGIMKSYRITLEELHAMEVNIAKAGDEIDNLTAERDAAQARVAELEKQDQEDSLTPPELLASKMIEAWVEAHGKKIPWDKAIHISAIITKMPDEERDRLLAMADAPVNQAGQVSVPRGLLERLIQILDAHNYARDVEALMVMLAAAPHPAKGE